MKPVVPFCAFSRRVWLARGEAWARCPGYHNSGCYRIGVHNPPDSAWVMALRERFRGVYRRVAEFVAVRIV